MHLSTTTALTALALGCSAPVWAWDGWDGEPALRLRGEVGLQAGRPEPAQGLRTWAHDLSARLAFIARPQLPELQWRGDGVPATARFAQPLHRKRWARAVTQQALQARAVVRRNANASVYREAAVLVAQHLFGLETLEQTAPNKGAQDASAQAGLCLGGSICNHAAGRVEDDAIRHFLKHAINHADVEVHVFVQAGAKAVNKGDRADV